MLSAIWLFHEIVCKDYDTEMTAPGVDPSGPPTTQPQPDVERDPVRIKEENDQVHDPQPISRERASLSTAVEGKEKYESTTTYSNTSEPSPAVVPRLKRRGLFGQFTLLAEVENPKTYPRKTKWFITFIVAVAGATAPMGSSIFFREYNH